MNKKQSKSKKITVWKVVRVIDSKYYSAITPSYYDLKSKWVLEYKSGIKQRRRCFAFDKRTNAARFLIDNWHLNLTVIKATAEQVRVINRIPAISNEKAFKDFLKNPFAAGLYLNAPKGTLFCSGLTLYK